MKPISFAHLEGFGTSSKTSEGARLEHSRNTVEFVPSDDPL